MPPSTKKKKAQPVEPTPPPAPPPLDLTAPFTPPVDEDGNPLPVLYPKIEMYERSILSEHGPLTIDYAKDALGWETEKEYQARKVKQFPDTKPEAYIFGTVFHCYNVAGEKVRCNNNGNNRYFDPDWSAELIHTILHGQWAGPFTVPGGTINGETVRISNYGRTISGQHQMTALILAGEVLRKARVDKIDTPDKPKYPTWKNHGEPFIETATIKGVSEDPRVLLSVDYVKPRTVADVFYTSQTFKDCIPIERKELCKMLATGADTLWTRTRTLGYRTHPEIVAFLERHKRLMHFVEHLYGENSLQSQRKLTKLRLNAGICAALCYIQASSGPNTDGDVYRNPPNEEPPSEKNLDWYYQDKAESFWTLLANGKDFVTVRTALANLFESAPSKDDNQGLGGRGPEKLAVLAKAWERWKDFTGTGYVFDLEDLKEGGQLALVYSSLDAKGGKLPPGQVRLISDADFEGIDCPESITKKQERTEAPEPVLTKEEIEEAIANMQKRREPKQGQQKK